MSKSAPKQGPTAEEIQLGNQAQIKYEASNKLSGGADYLLNTLNVDSTGRNNEKANAQNAVAFASAPDSNEEQFPIDLRSFTGGGVASAAQNDADKAATLTDLGSANLGVMANNSSAAYAEGNRKMALESAEIAKQQQKDALIPSLAGNAIGMYAGGGFDHWMSTDSPYKSTAVANKIKAMLPNRE